jgi:peptidoglycan-associated lipoprotein
LFTTSCAKKTVTAEPAKSATAEDDAAKEAAAEAARRAEMERQKQLEEERLKAEGMKGETLQAAMQFESTMIHFDFDKSNLRPDAQATLREQAAYLQAYPRAKVVIEGHCDERGTTEYNLALGDRRANSTKAFLVNLGIAESRMTTISYGEERPLDSGSNEAAWAKNRRAQFVLE